MTMVRGTRGVFCVLCVDKNIKRKGRKVSRKGGKELIIEKWVPFNDRGLIHFGVGALAQCGWRFVV
jgi:hypothetical protein